MFFLIVSAGGYKNEVRLLGAGQNVEVRIASVKID